MNPSHALAAALAACLTPALSAQPLVKPESRGIHRALDPANSAGCLWGLEPHHHHHHHAPARANVSGVSTTLINNGDPDNRIDLVIVGDGYTAPELPLFADHAQNGIDDLFATSPFSLYRPLFNVHRVDVVSNESGVDNDPARGIERDTALGMAFWCTGVERLLCVNTAAAFSAALSAPGHDQIFAVANSTKYGGAGYTSSNTATYAGGNASAPEVAIHELGHSLGDLADEYTYGGPTKYTGAEPSARNVSVYNAQQLDSKDRKWRRWLGVNDPMYDGLVDAYEGANYSSQGIYRPTANSIMRNLGREFNLPSAESLIIEMWRIVDPIDLHSPADAPVSRAATLTVLPAAPFLTARWYLDGSFAGVGYALDLASLSLAPGPHTVHVVVTDETPLVRDETARELYMTHRVHWTIAGPTADLTGDGAVNTADLAVLLAAWGTPAPDLNADGVCGPADLALMLSQWG